MTRHTVIVLFMMRLIKRERLLNMSQEVISRANEIINSKTGYIGGGMEGYVTLALIDENGYPTASTLTIAKADGIKWLTFCTSSDSNKVKRIKECNRAAVCANSSEYNITLVGTIEVLTDAETRKDNWLPAMEVEGSHWSGYDDPAFCVLRFTSERYNLFVGYEEAAGKF
jgi:general stress protein 26